jgi:hypothetical protein
MPFYITKSSGKKEFFNLKKLTRSLRKAGASSSLIGNIIARIKTMRPTSTQEIHTFALKELAKQSRPIAAHYNLKQALMNLGPAGYAFEQYIARILQADGYKTMTHQFIQGLCITHEIDVIAAKKSTSYLIECKFHNRMGLKTDVKVPLYIRARFEDIQRAERNNPSRSLLDQAWIWSNTQFTADAIKYAQCVNIRLTGWAYPEGSSLADLIDRYALYPITALTCLNQRKKNILIEHGILLCKDIFTQKSLLTRLGCKPYEIEQAFTQAQEICELKAQQ